MSALLTADWFQLDSYYRKFDIYNMNWSMDEGLDNMIISGAPYGGPIAVVRDRKQFGRIATTAKPVITIYNCAGNVISKILWNSGVLVHMGWSDGEQLLCVQESGDVLIYDMFGAYQKTFNMGQEVRDTKVSKAQLFPNPHGVGLGVMTTTNRMFLLSNISEPKVRPVPDLPRANEPITSWCVLSAGLRSSAAIYFLVCREKEVYKCQLGEPRPVLMRPEIRNPYTQILSIVPSQNGRHVALFTDSGFLWIGSSDFKSKYCETDTGYIKQPKELVWCGSQAVVAHWDDMLYVFGTKGGKEQFFYDGPFHVVAELDCVRVVSELTHELLERVPQVIEKIFRIDSTAPGSYLVEASKQFQKRSHRADEYIRLVKPDLAKAVQDCIDAAAFEFEPDVQKMLVRAAHFGKGFIVDQQLTDHYVRTCRWLRVLNAIRDPKVAIPLTFYQVQNLGERILLDRLIWRRLHCLALHIAGYLQLKDGQTRVLSHWACYKVTQPHLDNESAAREIGEKLRNVPGISYTTIAKKASEKGRKALAIKILEYESRSKLQVPLLLQLGEGQTALLKATASGDTDLVYIVLLHLKEKMGKHEFELTIRSFPLAHALYIKYCGAHNREALRKVLVQEDEFPAQAAAHVRDACAAPPPPPGAAEAALISARECYKKAKNDLGNDKVLVQEDEFPAQAAAHVRDACAAPPPPPGAAEAALISARECYKKAKNDLGNDKVLVQEDEFPAQAAAHVRDACAAPPPPPGAAEAALISARECYKKAKNDLGNDKVLVQEDEFPAQAAAHVRDACAAPPPPPGAAEAALISARECYKKAKNDLGNDKVLVQEDEFPAQAAAHVRDACAAPPPPPGAAEAALISARECYKKAKNDLGNDKVLVQEDEFPAQAAAHVRDACAAPPPPPGAAEAALISARECYKKAKNDLGNDKVLVQEDEFPAQAAAHVRDACAAPPPPPGAAEAALISARECYKKAKNDLGNDKVLVQEDEFPAQAAAHVRDACAAPPPPPGAAEAALISARECYKKAKNDLGNDKVLVQEDEFPAQAAAHVRDACAAPPPPPGAAEAALISARECYKKAKNDLGNDKVLVQEDEFPAQAAAHVRDACAAPPPPPGAAEAALISARECYKKAKNDLGNDKVLVQEDEFPAQAAAHVRDACAAPPPPPGAAEAALISARECYKKAKNDLGNDKVLVQEDEFPAQAAAHVRDACAAPPPPPGAAEAALISARECYKKAKNDLGNDKVLVQEDEFPAQAAAHVRDACAAPPPPPGAAEAALISARECYKKAKNDLGNDKVLVQEDEFPAQAAAHVRDACAAPPPPPGAAEAALISARECYKKAKNDLGNDKVLVQEDEFPAQAAAHVRDACAAPPPPPGAAEAALISARECYKKAKNDLGNDKVLVQEDEFPAQAAAHVRDACAAPPPPPGAAEAALISARECYKKAKNDLGNDKVLVQEDEFPAQAAAHVRDACAAPPPPPGAAEAALISARECYKKAKTDLGNDKVLVQEDEFPAQAAAHVRDACAAPPPPPGAAEAALISARECYKKAKNDLGNDKVLVQEDEFPAQAAAHVRDACAAPPPPPGAAEAALISARECYKKAKNDLGNDKVLVQEDEFPAQAAAHVRDACAAPPPPPGAAEAALISARKCYKKAKNDLGNDKVLVQEDEFPAQAAAHVRDACAAPPPPPGAAEAALISARECYKKAKNDLGNDKVLVQEDEFPAQAAAHVRDACAAPPPPPGAAEAALISARECYKKAKNDLGNDKVLVQEDEFPAQAAAHVRDACAAPPPPPGAAEAALISARECYKKAKNDLGNDKVLVQEDEFPAQAAAHVRDACAAPPPPPGAAEAALISARECYKKAKNDLGVAICEDARKLCKQQSSLQETYGESFVGLSLHDTVKKLLGQGEVKLADKLRSEYKMPDRRYWWLRILTLAEMNEWEELDRFSRAKKSPVGYEPFVDACLKWRKNDEALKYLPRCRDDIKVKYYVKAGFYEEAAQVAFEQRDQNALLYVQNKCPMNQSTKHERIASLLEQLATRK